MADLVTRPIVSGSSWNAAGNPIIYTLQRQDGLVNQCNNVAGLLQLQCNGGDLTSLFSNGDALYFTGYGSHFFCTGSSFSGGNTLINTNTGFISNLTGSVVNNSIRTDWRLYVNFVDASSEDLLPADLIFSHDRTGLLRVDAQILKNYISANLVTQVTINEIETETSVEFFLKYTEFYDNAYLSTLIDTSPIYAVYAAMQIGSANGGNMLAYNLIDDISSKFLQRLQPTTTLTKMVAWRDYPFTISFLWSTTDTTIYRRSSQFDASGVIIGAQTFDLISNHGINTVHRLSLPTLNAACKTVRIAITENTSSGTGPMLTEDLLIEIRDACDYNEDFENVMAEKNPIHLWCKNIYGGDLWWNFSKYHEYQYTYSNGKKAKRIQLFETGLHPVQWEALQDFNTIGEVYQNNIVELTSSILQTSTRIGQQVYIVSKDGTKKTGVIVIPSSDSGFAKDNVNLFSLTIELPAIFGME